MTTKTFSSEKELHTHFNFHLQPHAVKFVNGIAVNVSNGSLIFNELSVTKKSVRIESYSVDAQTTYTTRIHPPYTIKY